MANEVTYTAANERVAAVLHNEMAFLLADRASIRNHPAIADYSNLAGRGSTALKVPLFGLAGYNAMAATNADEVTAVGNTALTTTAPTITIARYALARERSDLYQITDPGLLNVDALAADMVGAYDMAVTTALAALASGFSNSVGTSGVDLSVDDFYAAIFQLEESNVPGQFLAVLHPVQVSNLQASLRLEGGANQYKAATQDMLDAKGQGYAGMFAGVDIFKSSKVATANAGADRAGMMIGMGAIGFAAGSPQAISTLGGDVVPSGTEVMVEFERDSAAGLQKIVGSAFFGVAELQDAMGVGIITDA
jgi:stage V sporulation protein SpoVS